MRQSLIEGVQKVLIFLSNYYSLPMLTRKRVMGHLLINCELNWVIIRSQSMLPTKYMVPGRLLGPISCLRLDVQEDQIHLSKMETPPLVRHYCCTSKTLV